MAQDGEVAVIGRELMWFGNLERSKKGGEKGSYPILGGNSSYYNRLI